MYFCVYGVTLTEKGNVLNPSSVNSNQLQTDDLNRTDEIEAQLKDAIYVYSLILQPFCLLKYIECFFTGWS